MQAQIIYQTTAPSLIILMMSYVWNQQVCTRFKCWHHCMLLPSFNESIQFFSDTSTEQCNEFVVLG